MKLKIKKKKRTIILLVLLGVIVISSVVCFILFFQGTNSNPDNEYCIPNSCFHEAESEFDDSPEIAAVCISFADCPSMNFNEYERVCISQICFVENKFDNSSHEDKLCMPKSCVSMTKKPGKKDKCLSDECVHTASSIVSNMNKNIRPCDDFYDFACGNFARDSPNSAFSARQLAESITAAKIRGILENADAKDPDALQKAKQVYKICMDEERIEEQSLDELKGLLTSRRFGVWPSLDHKWNDCNLDLEWRMGILNAHGVDSVIRIVPEFRGINQTLYGSLYVAPPVVSGICDDEFETDDGNFTDFSIRITRKHRSMMLRILNLLDAPENMTEGDLDDFFRFDAKFCHATKASRKFNASYEISNHTIQDLNFIAPEINWNRWHNILFNELGLSHRMDKSPINVYGLEKSAAALADLLGNTNSRVLANYFSWKFVFHHLGFTAPTLSRMAQDHRYLFPETADFLDEPWSPRWKHCAEYTAKAMPIAIIPSYLASTINNNVYHEMNATMKTIRATFNETFKRSAQMNTDQKKKSMRKIGRIRFQLLYPKKDKKYLDGYYSEVGLLPESFLYVGLILKRFHLKKMFEGVLNNTNITDIEYFIGLHNPFKVGEWSDFPRNITMFSFASFESMDFKVTQPRYLNYGTFGTSFARQIVRGFDLPSFSGESMAGLAPKNWTIWPNKIIQHLEMKSLCFKKHHYFHRHHHRRRRRSRMSRNDNIAYLEDIVNDNQAVLIAFKAYQKFLRSLKTDSERKEEKLPTGYSNHELFFIRYAQMWCNSDLTLKENKYIVNGVLRNLKDFSTTFECSEGDDMNPKFKCKSLWTDDE